jgi:hypothetical protein
MSVFDQIGVLPLPSASTPSAANAVKDWNFQQAHVQNDLKPGEFVNSCTTLICFGPPELSVQPGGSVNLSGLDNLGAADSAAGEFYPAGVTDSYALSQNKMMQQLFEIGSYKPYIVPGATTTSAQMGRTFYNGPSLLRCLYANYKDKNGKFPRSNPNNSGFDEAAHFANVSKKEIDVQDTPGFNGFWLNLASDLFNFPFGILLIYMDTTKKFVGSVFLKNGYVQTHNIGCTAGALIVAENTSLLFEGVVPVNVNVSQA